MSKGTYVVTGGASGLGAALVNALRVEMGFSVLVLDLAYGVDVTRTETLPPVPGDLLGVINCAGINANDWFEDADEEQFDNLMAVNAKAIMITGQWALEMLKRNKGVICNIVSNASHMPMTSSLAYNASKGAAHIMTLQLARELTKKYGITVFGVSPNKLAGTGMSRDIEANVQRVRGWTAEFARNYQLQSLLAGEETDPEACADFIAFLLSSKERHKFLSGCILPYGA